MAEILPGLTAEETEEFRVLMTPKVGPRLSDQQRLDRISRLRDLQSKIDKSPQMVRQRREEMRQNIIESNQMVRQRREEIRQNIIESNLTPRGVKNLPYIEAAVEHARENPNDLDAQKTAVFHLLKAQDADSVIRENHTESFTMQEALEILKKHGF